MKASKGILFALAGFSLFSFGDLVIKLLADDGFGPSEIAFFLQLFFLPLLLLLSPWIGGSCRYWPTCSEYARDMVAYLKKNVFPIHGIS